MNQQLKKSGQSPASLFQHFCSLRFDELGVGNVNFYFDLQQLLADILYVRVQILNLVIQQIKFIVKS